MKHTCRLNLQKASNTIIYLLSKNESILSMFNLSSCLNIERSPIDVKIYVTKHKYLSNIIVCLDFTYTHSFSLALNISVRYLYLDVAFK